MEYQIIGGRVQTRALEYHIADHCNLRCDHCCSFSPILKKWFADPDEFESDLRSVGRVVRPEFLKIVGGEPLLHPELERLLVTAKSLAVGHRIQLTTNAFLIDRLTARGWDSLDMIAVSLYPEPALPKERIRFIAREGRRRNIEINWKVQDQFTCLDRTEVASYADAARTFQQCWIRHRCNSIRRSRFYCCTRPQYVQKFATDSRPFLDDGIAVDDPDVEALGLRIKRHLEQSEPLHSCFLCQGGCAPLDTNRQLSAHAIVEKRHNMVLLSELIAGAQC
jgi:cyclic pyranopterin phosphate synthase